MEKSLNFNQVENERKQIIQGLGQRLSKDRLNTLIEYSIAYRAKRINHRHFYLFLKEICRSSGVELRRTPSFDRYLNYLLLTESLDSEKIFNEIRGLEKEIVRWYAQTNEEKQLITESFCLTLVAKLISFSLSPEDYLEYKRLAQEIQELKYFEKISHFENFYEIAQKRNDSIAFSLFRVMEENGLKTALLVSGGYHSSGINQRLRDQGITVISFRPRVTQIHLEDATIYLNVFTQEKAPLEKLFEGDKLSLAPNPYSNATHHFAALLLAGLKYLQGSNPKEVYLKIIKKNLPTHVKAKRTEEGVNLRFKNRNGKFSVNMAVKKDIDSNGKSRIKILNADVIPNRMQNITFKVAGLTALIFGIIAESAQAAITISVKAGDTLWDLAREHGLNTWKELYKANREMIGSNPNLIFPGQKLSIPNSKVDLIQSHTAKIAEVVPNSSPSAPLAVPESIPSPTVATTSPSELPVPLFFNDITDFFGQCFIGHWHIAALIGLFGLIASKWILKNRSVPTGIFELVRNAFGLINHPALLSKLLLGTILYPIAMIFLPRIILWDRAVLFVAVHVQWFFLSLALIYGGSMVLDSVKAFFTILESAYRTIFGNIQKYIIGKKPKHHESLLSKFDEKLYAGIALLLSFWLRDFFAAALLALVTKMVNSFEERHQNSVQEMIRQQMENLRNQKVLKIKMDTNSVHILNQEFVTVDQITIGDRIIIDDKNEVPPLKGKVVGVLQSGNILSLELAEVFVNEVTFKGEMSHARIEDLGFTVEWGHIVSKRVILEVTDLAEKTSKWNTIEELENGKRRETIGSRAIGKLKGRYGLLPFLVAIILLSLGASIDGLKPLLSSYDLISNLTNGFSSQGFYRAGAAAFVVICLCPIMVGPGLVTLVASKAAAKAGIILNNINAMTVPSHILFDKTNTLSVIQIHPERIESYSGYQKNEVAEMALLAEGYLAHKHHIGQALKEVAPSVRIDNVSSPDIHEKGITSTINYKGIKRKILVGNIEFLRSQLESNNSPINWEDFLKMEKDYQRLLQEYSVIAVYDLTHQKFVGLIPYKEEFREGALELWDRKPLTFFQHWINQLGISLFQRKNAIFNRSPLIGILTGDENPALAIQYCEALREKRMLGFVVYDMSPEDKKEVVLWMKTHEGTMSTLVQNNSTILVYKGQEFLEHVVGKYIQEDGDYVGMFVGDGVNDSKAIIRSDVGFALVSETGDHFVPPQFADASTKINGSLFHTIAYFLKLQERAQFVLSSNILIFFRLLYPIAILLLILNVINLQHAAILHLFSSGFFLYAWAQQLHWLDLGFKTYVNQFWKRLTKKAPALSIVSGTVLVLLFISFVHPAVLPGFLGEGHKVESLGDRFTHSIQLNKSLLIYDKNQSQFWYVPSGASIKRNENGKDWRVSNPTKPIINREQMLIKTVENISVKNGREIIEERDSSIDAIRFGQNRLRQIRIAKDNMKIGSDSLFFDACLENPKGWPIAVTNKGQFYQINEKGNLSRPLPFGATRIPDGYTAKRTHYHDITQVIHYYPWMLLRAVPTLESVTTASESTTNKVGKSSNRSQSQATFVDKDSNNVTMNTSHVSLRRHPNETRRIKIRFHKTKHYNGDYYEIVLFHPDDFVEDHPKNFFSHELVQIRPKILDAVISKVSVIWNIPADAWVLRPDGSVRGKIGAGGVFQKFTNPMTAQYISRDRIQNNPTLLQIWDGLESQKKKQYGHFHQPNATAAQLAGTNNAVMLMRGDRLLFDKKQIKRFIAENSLRLATRRNSVSAVPALVQSSDKGTALKSADLEYNITLRRDDFLYLKPDETFIFWGPAQIQNPSADGKSTIPSLLPAQARIQRHVFPENNLDFLDIHPGSDVKIRVKNYIDQVSSIGLADRSPRFDFGGAILEVQFNQDSGKPIDKKIFEFPRNSYFQFVKTNHRFFYQLVTPDGQIFILKSNHKIKWDNSSSPPSHLQEHFHSHKNKSDSGSVPSKPMAPDPNLLTTQNFSMTPKRYRNHMNSNEPDIVFYRRKIAELPFPAYLHHLYENYILNFGLSDMYTPEDIFWALKNFTISAKEVENRGVTSQVPVYDPPRTYDLVLGKNPTTGKLWAKGLPLPEEMFLDPFHGREHFDVTAEHRFLSSFTDKNIRIPFRRPDAEFTMEIYKTYAQSLSFKKNLSSQELPASNSANPIQESNHSILRTEIKEPLIFDDQGNMSNRGFVLGLNVEKEPKRSEIGVNFKFRPLRPNEDWDIQGRVSQVEDGKDKLLDGRSNIKRHWYGKGKPFLGTAARVQLRENDSSVKSFETYLGFGSTIWKSQEQITEFGFIEFEDRLEIWPGYRRFSDTDSFKMPVINQFSLGMNDLSLKMYGGYDPLINQLIGNIQGWKQVSKVGNSIVNLGLGIGYNNKANTLFLSNPSDSPRLNLQWLDPEWGLTFSYKPFEESWILRVDRSFDPSKLKETPLLFVKNILLGSLLSAILAGLALWNFPAIDPTIFKIMFLYGVPSTILVHELAHAFAIYITTHRVPRLIFKNEKRNWMIGFRLSQTQLAWHQAAAGPLSGIFLAVPIALSIGFHLLALTTGLGLLIPVIVINFLSAFIWGDAEILWKNSTGTKNDLKSLSHLDKEIIDTFISTFPIGLTPDIVNQNNEKTEVADDIDDILGTVSAYSVNDLDVRVNLIRKMVRKSRKGKRFRLALHQEIRNKLGRNISREEAHRVLWQYAMGDPKYNITGADLKGANLENSPLIIVAVDQLSQENIKNLVKNVTFSARNRPILFVTRDEMMGQEIQRLSHEIQGKTHVVAEGGAFSGFLDGGSYLFHLSAVESKISTWLQKNGIPAAQLRSMSIVKPSSLQIDYNGLEASSWLRQTRIIVFDLFKLLIPEFKLVNPMKMDKTIQELAVILSQA